MNFMNLLFIYSIIHIKYIILLLTIDVGDQFWRQNTYSGDKLEMLVTDFVAQVFCYQRLT